MKLLRPLIPLTLSLCLLAGCAGPADSEKTAPPVPSGTAEPSPATASPDPTPTPSPDPTPTPTPYDYAAPVPQSEKAPDDWFSDAVFIGDSRTDGLKLYGGIEGADYLSYQGLMVLEVLNDKKVIPEGEDKVGVLQALKEKRYGKVYVCLGINDLGNEDDEGFRRAYGELVDVIRQLQPDAGMYLQLLAPVDETSAREHNYPANVNNRQIDVYNQFIQEIAAEKEVYLLDVREPMTDENGALLSGATADGVHFTRPWYALWREYLETHTVREEVQ